MQRDLEHALQPSTCDLAESDRVFAGNSGVGVREIAAQMDGGVSIAVRRRADWEQAYHVPIRICDWDAPQSMPRKSCEAFSILTCSKALILNVSYRSNESLGMGFRLIEFDLESAFQERGFWAHPMEFIESRLYAARQFTRLMNVNIDGKTSTPLLKTVTFRITWASLICAPHRRSQLGERKSTCPNIKLSHGPCPALSQIGERAIASRRGHPRASGASRF